MDEIERELLEQVTLAPSNMEKRFRLANYYLIYPKIPL
jgi:hypothetical protein